MSNISTNQNLPRSIDFLIAQRFFYSKAKKTRNTRIIISVFFALLTPIIIYKWSETITIIGVIAGLWILMSHFLKKLLEDVNINKAAKIQEEFDVSLFKLTWNNILVGNKISPEEISYAKKQFNGNVSKLKNWYEGISKFPYPLDVLLCQRSNLVWDWRLKKIYSIVLFILLIMYFIITVIWSSVLDLKLAEYLTGLFIPALAGYFIGIDEAIEHYKGSSIRKKLEETINELSDIALNNNVESLEITKLRQIQDCIFRFRKGPLVPDWFYFFHRDSYEENMVLALKNFKNKLKTK